MRPAHALILAGLVLSALAIRPAPATGEPGDAETQLKTMALKPVATIVELPAAVQAGLARLFGQVKLDMAEPGAEWQVTDVIMKPNLPVRRLVAAGCSNEHCLIYYERGGIAHIWTVVMLRLDGPGADIVRGWAAPSGLGPVHQVQQAVAAGKLRTQTRFW